MAAQRFNGCSTRGARARVGEIGRDRDACEAMTLPTLIGMERPTPGPLTWHVAMPSGSTMAQKKKRAMP